MGKSYPFIYDHRHYFNIVGKYSFNQKWDIGINWLYHTGSAATIPGTFYYSYSDDIYGRTNRWGENKVFYNEKNAYRLPSYHRLDISINYKRENKFGYGKWTLSVYNVYNRKNTYTAMYNEKDEHIIGYIYYTKRYVDNRKLFGIIPSISYTLSF